MSEQRDGIGRIYLYPEPEAGAHPGYRGMLHADVLGVHLVAGGTEWLDIDPDDPYKTAWNMVEVDTTIPWSRIDQIGWDKRHAVGGESEARDGFPDRLSSSDDHAARPVKAV
jgi:hypothetical protein